MIFVYLNLQADLNSRMAFHIAFHTSVETIGDSYVVSFRSIVCSWLIVVFPSYNERLHLCLQAVTGLPEPQEKHALTMVRFAWDCLIKVSEVTTELESTLGPDTGTLTMRFGLHSGPVTVSPPTS